MLFARHPRLILRYLPPPPGTAPPEAAPRAFTCDLTGDAFAPLPGHAVPFLVYDPFTADGRPAGWQQQPFLLRIHPTLAADPAALRQALADHTANLRAEAEEKLTEAHLLTTLLGTLPPYTAPPPCGRV